MPGRRLQPAQARRWKNHQRRPDLNCRCTNCGGSLYIYSRWNVQAAGNHTAARRSYEKVGFVQEGIFRDMELLDGAYRDVVFMAKLAEN